MPTAKLLAVSQWLKEHLRELQAERAAIHAELRRRRAAGASTPIGAAGVAVRTLEYQSPQSARPQVGAVSDSYVDESRAYGLRVALIGAVILFFGGLILGLLAIV